jgi:hypothetical protein
MRVNGKIIAPQFYRYSTRFAAAGPCISPRVPRGKHSCLITPPQIVHFSLVGFPNDWLTMEIRPQNMRETTRRTSLPRWRCDARVTNPTVACSIHRPYISRDEGNDVSK